jgi:hypothetical protein
VCILAITWFSIITNALETHRNMKRLAGIAHYACDVEVMREGDMVKVGSSSTALSAGACHCCARAPGTAIHKVPRCKLLVQVLLYSL